jgi:hypothetical protein
MVALLKKQNTELKHELNETKALLLEKSKSLRSTSIDKLRVEHKQFINESIRLKAVIKSLSKAELHEHPIQEHIFQTLTEEIEESKAKLRQSEYDRDNLNSKIKLHQKELEKVTKVVSRLESELHGKTLEIGKLQEEKEALFLKSFY